MKLFLVDGIRHKAVVLAKTRKEAIELANKAYKEDNDRVLNGRVGDWEDPKAYELKLPHSYKLIKEDEWKNLIKGQK